MGGTRGSDGIWVFLSIYYGIWVFYSRFKYKYHEFLIKDFDTIVTPPSQQAYCRSGKLTAAVATAIIIKHL